MGTWFELGVTSTGVAVDKVRVWFGRHAVGYAAVRFDDRGWVPDEFRELAETTPGDPAETA